METNEPPLASFRYNNIRYQKTKNYIDAPLALIYLLHLVGNCKPLYLQLQICYLLQHTVHDKTSYILTLICAFNDCNLCYVYNYRSNYIYSE